MDTPGDKQIERQGHSNALVSEVKSQAAILGSFGALLWVIQIINAAGGGWLTQFGVHPRSLSGLWGILFAPFIHANFAHLIGNTVPLLVLASFVMMRKKRDLLTVSAWSAAVGGLGIWLIAPGDTVHIGASILIFGYLGYLLCRGIVERRFWPIVGSIVTFFAYGSALYGILPGQIGISWQGHLFGLIGGILAAYSMRSAPVAEKEPMRAPALPARTRVSTALPAAPVLTTTELDVDEELEALKARNRR